MFLRFLGGLVVALLIVVLIGMVAGWFSFGRKVEAGETEVSFRIDKEEVEMDFERVEDRVRSAIDDEEDVDDEPILPEGDSVVGSVVSVDPEAGTLLVRTPSDELVDVTLPNTVVVERGGRPAALADIEPGDEVRVEVTRKDGIQRAERIAVSDS